MLKHKLNIGISGADQTVQGEIEKLEAGIALGVDYGFVIPFSLNHSTL